MRQGERTYLCPACNTTTTISNEREPAVTIANESVGKPNVRIVSVAGKEVHRCLLPEDPRTVRWQ